MVRHNYLNVNRIISDDSRSVLFVLCLSWFGRLYPHSPDTTQADCRHAPAPTSTQSDIVFAALVAGLISFVILYFSGVANVFAQFNIFLRIMAASILCLCLYLIFIIALYRSVKPITDFVSLLFEMMPLRKNKPSNSNID